MNPHVPDPPHYVTGHRNPDTDSLASAVAYAWYLRHSGTIPHARPVRLGEAGPQAKWVFAQAGIDLPLLKPDCRYRVGDVIRRVETLPPEAPLGKALEHIHRGLTDAVPIVRDGRLVGIVSDRSAKTSYLIQCNVEEMIGTLLSFSHLVRGLDLKSLNGLPVPDKSTRLVFLNTEPGHETRGFAEGAIVVAGNQPSMLERAVSDGASGIIHVGSAHPPPYVAKFPIPAFHYAGSMGAFVSQLTSCFPCAEAMEDAFPILNMGQVVSEVGALFSKAPYSLPVTDDEDVFQGLLSARDIVALKKVTVSLVDHFERNQTIKGIDEAIITDIIDHHRIGDIESIQPLRVDCRPVGSSATILFSRCREGRLSLPADIALLLLGALVSDTLKLGSPTTTEMDRVAARSLAKTAGVDFDTFANEVLRQNDHLLTDPAEELVGRDCKQVSHSGHTFLAAQIETVDLGMLTDARAGELRAAFTARVLNTGAAFGALMVTDVLEKRSRIILTTDGDFALGALLPEGHAAIDPVWESDGWVSRKKQLIPYLLEKLNLNA